MLYTKFLIIKKIKINTTRYFKLIIPAIITAGFLLLLSENAYAQIDLKAIPSVKRVLSPADYQIEGSDSAEIYSARNEVESFQVVITAFQQRLENIRIEMTELTSPDNNVIGKNKIHLYREIFVPVRNSSPKATLRPGFFPDALVPLINPYTKEPTTGGRFLPQGFNLWEGHHQPIWVDIEVPKNAEPGSYTGWITVSADHVPSTSIQVKLNVWDFTLPDGPTHSNHFGNFSGLSRYYGTENNPEHRRRLEMRYIDLLAAHRLNPPIPELLHPPVKSDGSIDVTEDFDQTFTDFITKYHITDIEIPRATYRYPLDRGRTQTINHYRSWYQYLTNKGWENRAYLYMLDEPNSGSDYRRVQELGRLVEEAVPELKRLIVEQTYTQNPEWGTLDEAIDIWCPLFGFIHERSIDKVKDQGDEVWSYTALIQNAPTYHPDYEDVRNADPPYWEIDFPITSYRVPTWLNRRYGITGLLYWTTIQWASDPDRNVWDNPAFRGSYNGGGQLIYPGEEAGINGPVSSIRLKVLRDAMEDYEYFVLLEQKDQEALVNEIVNEVVPTWGSWKQNPEIYLKMRKKMGEAISSAN